MSATEFKWEVRQRNTGRFSILYTLPDGTPIALTGATAKLAIYTTSNTPVLEKSCNILMPNTIDAFLTVNEILAFDFEMARYEVLVFWPNGDVDTFVNGPIIVKSGLGPFE